MEGRELHICNKECDKSHKAWNENFPNEPIFVGDDIHHKNNIHEDNDPEYLKAKWYDLFWLCIPIMGMLLFTESIKSRK
jgi:hypothetical protein|tara:strand:+ start:2144 stop:2380 length:237 start_codon:yes stop_codon:yes gene_type:complete